MTSNVIGHNKALAEVALSLSEDARVNAAFLGGEVGPRSSVEETFELAWKAIGAGEMTRAVQLASSLLAADAAFDKAYFARGVAYARLGEWRRAVADYSSYLELTQVLRGASLANALYGRALCFARLGRRVAALRDLNEAIRVGPEEEQLTDKDPSLAPQAVVARLVLLQAYPQLAATQQAAAAAAAAAAAPAACTEGAPTSAADDQPTYEGKVWRAPLTAFEEALERAIGGGKVPLLLDATAQKVSDLYFLYAPATVVEAKRLAVERMAGRPVEEAREELRGELLHAMRHGHFLVVRMANSAADFRGAYCADDSFPLALFDQTAWPSGTDAASHAVFSKVVRPADTASGGMLHVPQSFKVVVTSTFKRDNYEALLKDSLPLESLQPIEIFEPSEKARAAALAGEGATNSGPLSGIISDWGGAWNSTASRTRGDAPRAGQLKGDQMSLFLSN
ncbi:hypothetical protein AB1Y20_010695 [Prymnesium parvum]